MLRPVCLYGGGKKLHLYVTEVLLSCRAITFWTCVWWILTPKSVGQSPYWEANFRWASVESEGSILCSQKGDITARWIQSTASHPICVRFILILFSHLYIGLSRGLLSYSFPRKILYECIISPMLLCVKPISLSLIWSSQLQIVNLLVIQFFSIFLFSNIITLFPSLRVRNKFSHPYRTTGRIILTSKHSNSASISLA